MNKILWKLLSGVLFTLSFFMASAQTLPPVESACQSIQIQTVNGELLLSGLDIAKTKARVFNANYDLVFSCEFDCSESVAIPNVTDGDLFHLTFEFFAADNHYIYQDNRDYTAGAAALAVSVCTGDVELTTQEEVNAFCGCEIIIGDLSIGIAEGNNIADISPLQTLKQLGGDLLIYGTNVDNLSALSNIIPSRDLTILHNNSLTSIGLFDEVEILYNISIQNNKGITQVDAFKNLKEVGFISFYGNDKLTQINGLGKLETTGKFNIANNASLKVFNEVPNLKVINHQLQIHNNPQLERVEFPALERAVSFGFSGNPNLKTIGAFQNLTVDEFILLEGNAALEDCCFLAKLVDDDPNNGTVNGGVILRNNSNRCNNIEDIVADCVETPPSTDCDNIAISSENNTLTIAGLTAPIVIAKVYDKNFALVFECNADCEETIVIPNLIAGFAYTLDLQFFTIDYQLICEHQQRLFVTGDGSPCIPSVCQGDVNLETQTHVDAFCGCEVIEGSLYLGNLTRGGALSDISSLETLANLKKVNGRVNIKKTILEDLTGLDALESVRVLSVDENPNLKTLNGLQQLTKVEAGILLDDSEQLSDLSALSQVEFLSAIYIQNIGIQNMDFFSNLELTSLRTLNINKCKKLTSLTGLETIQTISGALYNQVSINENPLLTDLSGLKNLQLIEGKLFLSKNAQLSDCCSIAHLLDDDETNGTITEEVFLHSNPSFCGSVAEIVDNCEDTPPTPSGCDAINIVSTDNSLKISGITAPIAVVKVFDNNWQLAFECNANCEETITLSDLTAGDIYHTDIQFYTANWQAICSDNQDITIQGGGNPCDDSVCQGDIRFTTQAEVDAFCGCEVIEGDLIITPGLRFENGVVSPPAAISDISNLSGLKEVKGNLVITNTLLKDLSGLNEITNIRQGMVIQFNFQLENLKGLENLKSVESILRIAQNDGIKNLNDLAALNYIGGFMLREKSLEDISLFSQVEISSIFTASIIRCTKLKSLNGLNRLQNIVPGAGSRGTFEVIGNLLLTDITALRNLKKVTGNMNISYNEVLTDCCTIVDLIDDDPTNGVVQGEITIENNPAFCSTIEEIVEKCKDLPPPSCEDLVIYSENNSLIIEGITAANAIVKVFDKNYQLILECSSNCEDPTIISDLNTGETYHTDIQFYDANWQFICSDRQDITIQGGSNPCDDSICQGNVVLETQADIDAFCGCEEIEGELLLGPGSLSSPPNDIINIENLSSIKRIGQDLVLINTQLTNFSPLANLVQVGGNLVILGNTKLENLKGLENVENIGNALVLERNDLIKNFNDLQSLTGLKELVLNGKSIESLQAFDNKLREELSFLSITDCDQLTSLAGVNATIINQITIAANDRLQNIDALKSLKMVQNLTIDSNDSLTSCCAIAHLLDDNLDNGNVEGPIVIRRNAAFCNSVAEIVEKCDGTPPSICDNIQITTATNTLTISGLVAPIAIVKVFDKNWQLIYECYADCEESITLTDLVGNTFHLQIANYDENWRFLCHGDQTVTLSGDSNTDRNTELQAADFSLHPNPAYENAFIDLKPLKGEAVTLTIYNQFGRLVYQQQIEKVADSKKKIDLAAFSNGLYLLQIQVKGKRAISKKLLVSRLY